MHQQGTRLAFSVEDDGVGLAKADERRKPGIGLSNLRARLDALYGGQQKVELIQRPEGGVAVYIEIPLRQMELGAGARSDHSLAGKLDESSEAQFIREASESRADEEFIPRPG